MYHPPPQQPLGAAVAVTSPAKAPERKIILGKHVGIVPLDESHTDSLFLHTGGAENAELWTYMYGGPWLSAAEHRETMIMRSKSSDPLYYSVFLPTSPDNILGYISAINFNAQHRTLEVGVMLSKALKRTRSATELFYLFFSYAFEELGIRRLEWKCNSLNEPSLIAARRLGFVFEGVFRQHMILKGRNRDTAWLSMTDTEWPRRKAGLEEWLQDSNFDDTGLQRKALNISVESEVPHHYVVFQAGRE